MESRMLKQWRGMWLAVWLFACGCSGADSGEGHRADSLAAGRNEVRVVPDRVRQDSEWALDLIARIGAEDGPDAAVFASVCDYVFGSDTSLYVLDCRSADIRVFDLNGRHVRSFGRSGDGPGEFRSPFALAFDPEGRLWVADESALRYTVWSEEGTLVTTARRPIRWPATSGALQFSRTGTLHEYGWWSNDAGAVIRIAADSAPQVLDTIPLSPWSTNVFSHRERPAFTVAVPLHPHAVAAVGPDGEVWTGVGEHYRIALLTQTGDSARVVEVVAEPEPLSTAERQEAEAAAAALEQRGFAVDARRLPRTRPYFTSLVVSDLGEIWVRRFGTATDHGEDRRATYDVFAPNGDFLASVELAIEEHPPPKVQGDYLIGISRDELDREYVLVYRIRRGAGTP